jgi:2-oxoisovalerate dehydrogenase E2 component (dihydrolipoyl transacylase)
MSEIRFPLPDVGEGLTEAEIVQWRVAPGDRIALDQVFVEIETAKSLVELQSPYAGVVEGLLVEEGATVPVGTPIIAVRTGAAPAAPDMPADARAEPGAPGGAGEVGGPAEDLVPSPAKPDEARQAVLVGYGPRATTAKRRARKEVSEGPDHGEAEPVRALAKPPVRKLAKDLGVDLTAVTPSGAGGTITREDVQAWAAGEAPPPVDRAIPAGLAGSGWDGKPREERIAIRSVRKATAEAVSRSAFTAPHVTEFVTVDATRTMRLVKRLRDSRDFRDVRLSPLAVLARAMCVAVRRTPDVNSRWDEEAGEIVIQRYVNLGIAAATPRGLVVPNIKDADRLPLRDLAVAINELAATAREGKTPPSDMTGGTMSITNVGVFGIDTGTPILPPGEAAIMAFGVVRQQPWVHRGKVKPRWVTTLALSFDHRVVDGEQGSRFLADVAAILEDPSQALVWG